MAKNYQLTQNPDVVRFVPDDITQEPTDIDCSVPSVEYNEYLKWLSNDHTSLPADPFNKQSRNAEIVRKAEAILSLKGVDFSGKNYPCDLVSRINMLMIVIGLWKGYTLPANFVLRTSNDRPIAFTEQQLYDLFKAMTGKLFEVLLAAGEQRDT